MGLEAPLNPQKSQLNHPFIFNFKTKLHRLFWSFFGFLPAILPQNDEDFDLFCEQICMAYGLPLSNAVKQAIATSILHLEPTTARKPLRYFACIIEKSMSNQCAYDFLQEEKQRINQAATQSPTDVMKVIEHEAIPN